MVKKVVSYRGIECQIIFDYRNGNYEILCLDEIILVNERQIERLDFFARN